MAIPKYDDLFNPLLDALRVLGGSASVQELEKKVGELLKLSDEDANEIHNGNRTVLGYRLAWARNYLKRYGLLENSSQGVWALTQKGNSVTKVEKKEVNKFVKGLDRKKQAESTDNEDMEEEEIKWQDELLQVLKELSPAEFERLCQRILRESGFIEVTVTGKTGDGGIDGRGLIRIGGFLSFRVIFQCKRYKGNVSSQQIREFKGTMAGRADKGLFITTGGFTRDAIEEATRDGSAPIDLVTGQELVQKMKELKLGVTLRTEEVVEINKEWFKNF